MMVASVRLGLKSAVSGATARAFEVVTQSGDYKEDEIYLRGLEIERRLADQELANNEEEPSK